jgi:hypothetical protein
MSWIETFHIDGNFMCSIVCYFVCSCICSIKQRLACLPACLQNVSSGLGLLTWTDWRYCLQKFLNLISVRHAYLWIYKVITSTILKSSVFWDIMSCSLLKINQCFGGTCCLRLQGRRIRWTRNQHVPPKYWLSISGLHRIISQKRELFIITVMRTSDPSTILLHFS